MVCVVMACTVCNTAMISVYRAPYSWIVFVYLVFDYAMHSYALRHAQNGCILQTTIVHTVRQLTLLSNHTRVTY